MMRRWWCLLVTLWLAVPLLAQDPNTARGFASGSSYRNYDIDSINQFNGNLILRIGLFEALPVGPFLSLSLGLSYNSKIYDYEFLSHQNDSNDTFSKQRALPETYSNAGLGWTLGLGRLMAPQTGPPAHGWLYRAADGSEHVFTTHHDDTALAYTHDGSFLRLKRYPDNTSLPATHREIEFPDGTIHQFNPAGHLTEIRDLHGHWIRVADSDPMKWVITSGYNSGTFRTTTVNFVNRTAPANHPPYQANFQKVVSSIEVPAFGGTTTATYEFIYQDSFFPRVGCGDQISYDPDEFSAPLLTEIRLPDTSKYVATYLTTNTTECAAGIIKAMKLPTMGSIEWTHQPYLLSQAECDDGHGWVVASPGIHKRILKDAQGNTAGEWTYTPSINLQPPPRANVECGEFNLPFGYAPTEATTTVTTPAGKTVHYFSAALHGSPDMTTYDFKSWEYGLPFTRYLDSSGAGRFLSTRRFDASNVLVRSTYVTFAGDQVFDERLSNVRVQGDVTIFNGDTGCNDADCRVDTDRTDYDGYGHYRKSVTSSNFGPPRTTFTNYTPNATSWILGTYDSSWVEEGGKAAKQLFTFDEKGVLSTRRTLIGAASTASSINIDTKNDLLEVHCRDERGFLTSQKFFGGDGDATIPTSDLCTAIPTPAYQIDHVFTFNSDNAPTKHTAKYTGMPFFIADDDLDAKTGLVSTSRDVSEVPTAFEYDKLGRVTTVKPTGTAWTMYEYSKASATTPASVRVATRAEGTSSTATPLSDAHVHYDSLGRAIQEKRKIPSDTGLRWSTTNTAYDAFNRKTNVSVPEFRDTSAYESDFAPVASTSMTYDVFGRPLTVTTPDAKVRFTSYTGNGVREVKTQTEVALTTGDAFVMTTQTFDAYGRLIQVTEPNLTKTQHKYDLAGRLVEVCQNATGTPITCGQTRTFVYDNRGFLKSETHPENGMVSYTYDARGHALTRTINGDLTSAANLKFTYDAAERVTGIQTLQTYHPPPTPSVYRPGKVFVFGTANTGTNGENKKLGKLTSATRYNYNAGELVVTESYDYENAAGRPSKTTTEITKDGSQLQKLAHSQTYDSGGNVDTITYPTCVTGGVACGAATWNTSTLTSSNGFLTSVHRFADSISYTPAGTVSKLDHAGPVIDTYTPDVTGARPQSIQFAGHTSCTGPSITTGSPQDQSISPGQTATLTVSATGAAGYQWFDGNGTKLAGQTGSSFTTPPLTGTGTWYVEVYNDCQTVQSRLVTVNACPDVTVTAGTPQDQSIAPEQTATLSVSATGATGYQWYDGNGTQIPGQTASTFTTPPLITSKSYYVVASNGCWTVPSRTATVTVRSLAAPTVLIATANGTASVSITWNASVDAHHYVLERKSNGSAYLPIQSVYSTAATDSSVVANTTYLYRVRAVSSGELVSSPPSNADLATPMAFTPLVAGQTVVATHFHELLTAVNALRVANGTPPATWASILPPDIPAPASEVVIRGQHLLTLRLAMDAARTALNVSPLSYTDPSVIGATMKVVHMTELRGGVQ